MRNKTLNINFLLLCDHRTVSGLTGTLPIHFLGFRNCVIGFIKVGVKKLFLYDHKGQQKEVSPLCVLDFYVHESKQRMGYGKLLFEHMLRVCYNSILNSSILYDITSYQLLTGLSTSNNYSPDNLWSYEMCLVLYEYLKIY